MNGHEAAGAFVGALVLCEILAFLFAILLSRAPLRVIARLLRAIGLLKRTGGAPSVVDASSTSEFKSRLGGSAFAAIERIFRPETATDVALHGVDAEFERDDGRSEGPYDFANNEEKKLSRRGILFRWISVRPAYMPDTSPISDEVVNIYVRVAQRFFRSRVDIAADVTNLYEDVDAAVTIALFRVRDRKCYYLLNEMRRIINDNVRKLAFLYSSIILSVLTIELFYIDWLDQPVIAKVTHGVVAFAIDYWDRSLGGVALCAAGAFFMWLTYYMEYVPNQRSNGREMRSFLSRYLSRLSDRYRDSLANARAVTVGDETDGDKLSAAAQKWHKVMLWLSFRAFFVETFIRNILFQIGRNCGYYIVFGPLVLVVVVGTTLAIGTGLAHIDLAVLFAAPGPLFYLAFALLVALAVGFLINAMYPIDEMNQSDWLGFENFNVDRGMDDVVGKYAEDVGYWKGRLG